MPKGFKSERLRMKPIKPNYVDVINPDEVTLYARECGKTGSKLLHRFSSNTRNWTHRVGDNFMCGGTMYLIERIESP